MSHDDWGTTNPDMFTAKPLTPEDFDRLRARMSGVLTKDSLVAYIMRHIGIGCTLTWHDFDVIVTAPGELLVTFSSCAKGQENQIRSILAHHSGLQVIRVTVKQAGEAGTVSCAR